MSSEKRKMTPAIVDMSVKEERTCLSEIRSRPDIKASDILSNGWTAGRFALRYILGHRKKRKSKNNNNLNDNPTSSIGCTEN